MFKTPDRRRAPRHRVRFTLVVVNGAERVAGIGMEMSLTGCLIGTKRAPAGSSLSAILDIGERKIPVQLNSVRSGTIDHDGEPWTLLGCRFSGVAAEDHEALVRFLAAARE
jgi:hypothetical protein